MSEHLGDLAARVAGELREKHLGEIESGERLIDQDTRVMISEGRGLMAKVDFRWRKSDEMVLDQIRSASAAVFEREFSDVIAVLDDLYAQIRVPKVNVHGVVVRDESGRTVWERDERGAIVEDWSQITGQDLERAIFDLQRVRFGLSVRVNELQNEALFAKHIYEDNYHDAYSSVIEGTVRDREAKASRESREEKYLSYFKFVIWSGADTFSREINNFQRLLERTRDWGVRSTRG